MSDLSGNDILSFLLLAGACVGHLAIMVYAYNWWYGVALSRFGNKAIRVVHAALMLAGLATIWHVYGLDLPGSLYGDSVSLWRLFLNAYLLLCWAIGFGVLPALTLARLLRRAPAILVSNDTRTVDIAAELGYKPIGRGKHRHLARLPRNEVFQVDLSERTFRLPGLPAAWDGLSILHVSDLHLCGTPDREFYQFYGI